MSFGSEDVSASMAEAIAQGSGKVASQSFNAGDNANTTKSQDGPRQIPLESHLRTEPIHQLITEVKLAPSISSTTTDNANQSTHTSLTAMNPITLQPFTMDELRTHKLESLLTQYPTPEAATKAREDTANELRRLLDENARKNKEIDREMEEKEKTREIERKVYRKLGKDA